MKKPDLPNDPFAAPRHLFTASTIRRVPRAFTLVNIGALLLALTLLGVLDRTLTPLNDDFKHYWQASIHVRNLGDPYAERLHPSTEVVQGASPTLKRDDYIYPPLLAYLLQPLGLLDLEPAQHVWFWLNVGLLGLLIASCIQASGSLLAGKGYGIVILLMVFAPPTRACLQIGQLGILIGLLSVLTIASAQRSPRVAGTLLGLASLLKVYPAFLGLAYLRDRRAVLRWLVASGFGLGLLSVLIYGFAPYLTYVERVLLHNARPYPLAAEFNVSIVGFWYRLFTANPYTIPLVDRPVVALCLSVASGGIVLALCLWASWRKHPPGPSLLQPCIWLCATLLLWPASGSYNLVAMLLPCLMILRHLETQRDTRMRQWMLLGTLLLYIPPGWSNLHAGLYRTMHIGWGSIGLAPAMYGIIIYLGLLVTLERRRNGLCENSERPV